MVSVPRPDAARRAEPLPAPESAPLPARQDAAPTARPQPLVPLAGPALATPAAFAAKLPLRELVAAPMPDPGVTLEMRHDGPLYTMVATTNESRDTFHVYQARHRDGPWTRVKDTMGKPVSIFPQSARPAWISTEHPDRWAPELHKLGDKWMCLYTARHIEGDLRVAVAIADCVTGPYRDLGPILTAPHGVIDATIVRDRKSGRSVMVYKNDDNAAGKPTPILTRPFSLEDDGVVWLGEPHEICRSGEGHGGLLEGPWLVHENDATWIVLSSDYYGGANYKMWIGTVDDLERGKVADLAHLMTSDSPCLRGEWKGPGHCSLVKEAPGIYSVYFHAWPAGTENTSDWNQRFQGGEQRKALRATLAFIDERGQACPPYIVEDRIKA